MIYDEVPLRRSRRNRRQVKTTGGVCLNGGKLGQMAFQMTADLQNQAIGWLRKGYNSLGGGTVVRFPRFWMSSGECRLKPPFHLYDKHVVHGYSQAPDVPIRCVDWSNDNGANWHEADLTSPDERYGWVGFRFEWHAPRAQHLSVDARD